MQDIPDVIYHEAAFAFIESQWSYKYSGQTGALVESYADVLTSLVKQKILGQTAKTADWTIAPGAIAWLSRKKDSSDRSPLRSLKAPGTAYDVPELGKDPQPDHFSKLVKLPSTASGDYGGVHINSGIPNRAFYEAAIRIGSQAAGKIWIASLAKFEAEIDFREASKVIITTAIELYGSGTAEAKGVKAAFDAVGLAAD